MVFCEREIVEKVEAFICFTWRRSVENYMLLDLQGADCLLCDPEVTNINLRIKKGGTKSEFYFRLGKLSTNVIHGFMSNHKCDPICRTLDFKEFEDTFV